MVGKCNKIFNTEGLENIYVGMHLPGTITVFPGLMVSYKIPLRVKFFNS